MSIDKDLLDQLMEGRQPSDLFGKGGILQELTKALAERALSTELDAHLTEERTDPPPDGANQPPNRRNGSSQKTVTTDNGKVVLDIPRDRPSQQICFTNRLPGSERQLRPSADRQVSAPFSGVRHQDHPLPGSALRSNVTRGSMYARGMTTREIQGHLEEIYGVEASPSLISAITDAVMEFKLVRAADQTVRGTV